MHSYHLTYDVDLPGGVEMRFNVDAIAPKLFAGLPPEVRTALGDERCKLHCTRVHSMLWRYVPDLLRRPLTIEGNVFAAELLAWPRPRTLCAFQLERDVMGPIRSVISGSAYGVAFERLVEILQALVIINHRGELLAQYQTDLDEQRRRLQPPSQ